MSPKDVNDLKKLYKKYGAFLSPENRKTIVALIKELENGGDRDSLKKIANQMQKNIRDIESNLTDK